MLLVTLITAQPMHTCQKPTMPPCQKQKNQKGFRKSKLIRSPPASCSTNTLLTMHLFSVVRQARGNDNNKLIN